MGSAALKAFWMRNEKKGFSKETGAVLNKTEQIIVVGIRKEPGTNVLIMTDRVEQEVERLNSSILADNGLYLDMVYDQRPYINTSINLVKQNVLVGGLLAVTVE